MPIKLLYLAVSALLAFSAHAQSINTLSEAEKKEGWQLLFDGKTTNGWGLYYDNSPKEEKWEVRDGAIHLIDRNLDWDRKDDLITEKIFGNFDLKIDWKIAPKGKSGILFHVQQDPSKYPFQTGLQMEVLDNEGYPERKNQKHWAGDLYDLIASPEMARPAGEWNQAEIYFNNDTLKFFLNGVNTISTIVWDDNWNTLVRNASARKQLPFLPVHTGKINLQNRGLEVWYRNIKIRQFPETAGNNIAAEPGNAPRLGSETMDDHKKMVGTWKILNPRPGGQLSSIFSNDHLEFQENGVGISRNDHSNTTDNVKFFYWLVDNNTLHLFARGGIKIPCSFSINNGVLTLKGALADKPMEASLQKISDNPMEKYKDFLPATEVEGRWDRSVMAQNGGMYDTPGFYYDIHPSTDNIGEIISYSNSDVYDSLYFIKYNLTINATKQLNINPAFKLLDGGGSHDTSGHFYSFNWLTNDAHEDVDCYVSDGIIIMNQFGHRTYYMTRSGPSHWPDVSSLHEKYNAHYGTKKLPPYGVHWSVCSRCGGSGNVVTGYDDVYDHTNAAGYSVYVKKERTSTCSVCNGVGGNYVYDKTGQKY